MFKLDSEEALLASFRPKDRAAVEMPKGLALPQFVRNYLAWSHPSGGYVYLVFAVPGGVPTGIVFDVNGGSSTVMQMCDWCHHSGTSGVGLLTATLNNKRRVGVNVCSDLSCQDKLEDAASRGGYSVLPAMKQLVERMGKFASETLKIDLSGANR